MARTIIKAIGILAVLQLLVAFLAFAGSSANPPAHAILGMAIFGLYFLWIIIGGLVQYRVRDTVKALWNRIALKRWLKFGLLATILALIEEAITTAMTNTASLYGTTPAAAHITASTNYLNVVLTHSVIFFAPMLFIWGWILSRYDLSPEAVFLSWGLTGTIMETVYGGPQQIIGIGMWAFVYGLMIYLPAYCISGDRPNLRAPSWWQRLLFIFIPLLGVIPGGILSAIFKAILHTHYLPGVQ